MKLSRIFQPRNPQFWLLIALLSTAISMVLRYYDLPLGVALLLVVFAFANMIIGLRIAWRLVSDCEPERSGGAGRTPVGQ